MLTRTIVRNGKVVFFEVDGIQQTPEPAEWPLWAKALKHFANAQDSGLGDVIARIIGPEASQAFKKWYKATFGKECGCNGRQVYLNRKYPLK